MITHGVSPLLIAAAAGYWVLTQAQKERARIKTFGQWLGVAIIAVSVAGAACKLYWITTGKPLGLKGLSCPAGISCPFTGKSQPMGK